MSPVCAEILVVANQPLGHRQLVNLTVPLMVQVLSGCQYHQDSFWQVETHCQATCRRGKLTWVMDERPLSIFGIILHNRLQYRSDPDFHTSAAGIDL
jgi:hypothetical protein